MISQAGVYKIKLFENKGLTFNYDSAGNIDISSIANTGEIIELTNNDNNTQYSNSQSNAGNNAVLNEHTINFELNGLINANFEANQNIESSIYGYLPLIEFMDKQIYFIMVPFFQTVGPVNAQVSHTFKIEMKPRVETFHKLTKAL